MIGANLQTFKYLEMNNMSGKESLGDILSNIGKRGEKSKIHDDKDKKKTSDTKKKEQPGPNSNNGGGKSNSSKSQEKKQGKKNGKNENEKGTGRSSPLKKDGEKKTKKGGKVENGKGENEGRDKNDEKVTSNGDKPLTKKPPQKMNHISGKRGLIDMVIDTGEREEISNIYKDKDTNHKSDVMKKMIREGLYSSAGKEKRKERKNGKGVDENDIGNILPSSKGAEKKTNKGGKPGERRGKKGRSDSTEGRKTSNGDKPLNKDRSQYIKGEKKNNKVGKSVNEKEPNGRDERNKKRLISNSNKPFQREPSQNANSKRERGQGKEGFSWKKDENNQKSGVGRDPITPPRQNERDGKAKSTGSKRNTPKKESKKKFKSNEVGTLVEGIAGERRDDTQGKNVQSEGVEQTFQGEHSPETNDYNQQDETMAAVEEDISKSSSTTQGNEIENAGNIGYTEVVDGEEMDSADRKMEGEEGE